VAAARRDRGPQIMARAAGQAPGARCRAGFPRPGRQAQTALDHGFDV